MPPFVYRPLLLLLVLVAPIHAQQLCNVCIGSGVVNPAGSIGPIPCTEWLAATSGTPSNVEACTLHRTAGARFCGCGDSSVFETCYLCGDAASNQFADADKYLPDSPDGSLTCGDLMEMPIVDSYETCPLIQEKYKRWCGCPNAPTTVPCPFCQAGGAPNLNLPYPFADASGPDCTSLNDWYQVQTSASCAAFRQADYQLYLIDMQAYCQCPARAAPEVCQGDYCPMGTGIRTEDLSKVVEQQTGVTCADTAFLAEMITKSEDCDYLFQTSSMCCSEVSEIVVPEPEPDVFLESTNVFETKEGFYSGAMSTKAITMTLAAACIMVVTMGLGVV